MKVKKGDKVIVMSGKDKGKQGEILSAFPKLNKVVIGGVNVVTKHNKPTQDSPGGIVKKEMPIDASNVAICIDDKPCKVGHSVIEGKKVRVNKKTGKVI